MNSSAKDGLIEYLISNYEPGSPKWKEIGERFGFEAEQARKIWLNYRQKNKIESNPQPQDSTSEEDEFFTVMQNYQSNWSKISQADKIINTKWNEESMLVINLPDLHFDKRDMDNTTIEENIDRYFEVLKYLVGKAYHSSKLEKIVFVIGNDIFNTDSIYDTTTNGTPQRCNTTWDVAYEKVFDAMIQSIALLSNFCKDVHVVLIQGNHDRAKSYYMAHALESYFRNDSSITFDRTPAINKAVIWGNSFIGFNHGNNINDKLPLAFAQEFYKSWGMCKYHDIYIGDKHNNNEKLFNKRITQNDGNQGVKLRILPSLSKPDRWHDDNLFRSRQSGIAILYDKERGKSAEFEYQL